MAVFFCYLLHLSIYKRVKISSENRLLLVAVYWLAEVCEGFQFRIFDASLWGFVLCHTLPFWIVICICLLALCPALRRQFREAIH